MKIFVLVLSMLALTACGNKDDGGGSSSTKKKTGYISLQRGVIIIGSKEYTPVATSKCPNVSIQTQSGVSQIPRCIKNAIDKAMVANPPIQLIPHPKTGEMVYKASITGSAVKQTAYGYSQQGIYGQPNYGYQQPYGYPQQTSGMIQPGGYYNLKTISIKR